MTLLLNDEELYVNGNAMLVRVTSLNECRLIAQAQLGKVVEWLVDNIDYEHEDLEVSFVVSHEEWQTLKKEAGIDESIR